MVLSRSEEHHITNIDAARRQLATAIELWFYDADIVSVHTLAYAAHEVIHVLTKKSRSQPLLYDNKTHPEMERNKFNGWIKKSANFFKHGGRSLQEGEKILFNPGLSRMFIMFSLLGLQYSGKQLNPTEQAFLFWFIYHEPRFLTEEGKKLFIDSLPVEDLESIRWLPKHEFFNAYMKVHTKAAAE